MEIIRSPQEMTLWSEKIISGNQSIALVPTMGYFHEGHLSLMRKARTLADHVAVSLFVNPIQFGPSEDLEKYPRDFDRDKDLAAAQGVSVLFAPETIDMYPEKLLTRVQVSEITGTLCGSSRPGHFEGVATVVAKLFNIIMPHFAVFGQKDFQQLAVIKKMVRDLNFAVQVIGHPIVREVDGLAMSSRNTYLSKDERRSALCLIESIRLARKRIGQGLLDADKLIEEIKELFDSYSNITVEYVDIVNKDNLKSMTEVNTMSMLVLAAKAGKTRLIDNNMLFEGSEIV
ncbi:MAG: pantoate--beta-alanine ligase [Proteobacteria bacterium]|nr:pantoate--beta-alanine ligase [Pseudomonadota bacterium]MBU1709325.1 pantoate--beta-alanine ligase [Pseudomonadota bacterium]